MDHNVYRELGEHTARLKALEEGQTAMDGKLDILLERSAHDQGRRAALWKVGAASGGGGGLIVAILQWISSIRGPH